MVHWIKSKNGKEYPIKFSQGVLRRLARHEGIPMNNLGKFAAGFSSWSLELFDRLIYYSVSAAARNENVLFEMTEEDFFELLEDDETIVPQAMQVFIDSKPTDEEKKTQKQAARTTRK